MNDQNQEENPGNNNNNNQNGFAVNFVKKNFLLRNRKDYNYIYS